MPRWNVCSSYGTPSLAELQREERRGERRLACRPVLILNPGPPVSPGRPVRPVSRDKCSESVCIQSRFLIPLLALLPLANSRMRLNESPPCLLSGLAQSVTPLPPSRPPFSVLRPPFSVLHSNRIPSGKKHFLN